jgi:phosphomannomutase
VPAQLDAIARRHGLHACRQWAVRIDGADGIHRIRDAVAALADAPPSQLDGRAVREVERPAEGVVVLHLDGDARVVVRPSGTEPKLKRYFQVVVDPVDDVAAARSEAAAALERLRDDLDGVLQL